MAKRVDYIYRNNNIYNSQLQNEEHSEVTSDILPVQTSTSGKPQKRDLFFVLLCVCFAPAHRHFTNKC